MRLIAILLAVPALLAALVLTAVGMNDLFSSTSPERPPSAGAFAGAIYDGDVEAAFDMIHNGSNPNALVPFQHPEFTLGREIMVSPLMLAVANRRDNVVSMLLNFGAKLELPQNRRAVCLATQIHADEIAQILRRFGGSGADTACPTPAHPGAPLLDYVQ